MDGAVNYVVKFGYLRAVALNLTTKGYYSTYEKALERVKVLAGEEYGGMIKDYWTDRWWNENIWVCIETFTLDEDIL